MKFSIIVDLLVVTVFPSLSAVSSCEEELLFSMDFTVSQKFLELELQDANFCLKKLAFAFLNDCVSWFLTSLKSCISRLWVRVQGLSQPAVTGRSMGRRTIGLASSGLGRVWPVGISLSHRALATPVAGRAQCMLTRSPGAQCFLWHIGAAGFRVGCTLC